MTRQHLGQHFLADVYWREQIAEAIRVSPRLELSNAAKAGDSSYCWVEIGPGHGEMTEYLAGSGVPVHAIEVDEKLIGNLNRLAKRFTNLEVVHRDILEADLAGLAKGRRIRVYGSLPYYIASPILHHLFQFAELIDEIHVVVQTEVAERMGANPGSKAYGYLSVATQLNARPELVVEIPRAAFNPPPEVSSTLVTLRLPGAWAQLHRVNLLPGENKSAERLGDDEAAFLEFVKRCFSKKRKTLVNNLREHWKPEEIRSALELLKLRREVRAEQIAIEDLAGLFTALQRAKGLASVGELPA